MHRQLLTLIILFTSTVVSTSVMADSTWQPSGPSGGGWIEDVVPHPTNLQEVWAMTDLSRLFRSQDAGVMWRQPMGVKPARGIASRRIGIADRIPA